MPAANLLQRGIAGVALGFLGGNEGDSWTIYHAGAPLVDDGAVTDKILLEQTSPVSARNPSSQRNGEINGRLARKKRGIRAAPAVLGEGKIAPH